MTRSGSSPKLPTPPSLCHSVTFSPCLDALAPYPPSLRPSVAPSLFLRASLHFVTPSLPTPYVRLMSGSSSSKSASLAKGFGNFAAGGAFYHRSIAEPHTSRNTPGPSRQVSSQPPPATTTMMMTTQTGSPFAAGLSDVRDIRGSSPPAVCCSPVPCPTVRLFDCSTVRLTH